VKPAEQPAAEPQAAAPADEAQPPAEGGTPQP
jgi:hypothetical protein